MGFNGRYVLLANLVFLHSAVTNKYNFGIMENEPLMVNLFEEMKTVITNLETIVTKYHITSLDAFLAEKKIDQKYHLY